MRRSEAEKIDTLEDKIKLELVQLDEKTIQMQHSMDGFANVSVKHACSSCLESGESIIYIALVGDFRTGVF